MQAEEGLHAIENIKDQKREQRLNLRELEKLISSN